MYESGGSHRTRSKAAPDWTLEESLSLVNEIQAVESEWGSTLPSFQKWQQIVENCYALGFNRNLNQCKRQWDALLNEYKLVNNGTRVVNGSFPVELFNAVDECLNSGCVKKKSTVAVEVDEPVVMDTDPDSDTEEQGRVTEFVPHADTKKKRRRMKRKNRSRVERVNPWGYFTSLNVKDDDNNLEDKSVTEETTLEYEQEMVEILSQNAIQISAILEANVEDEVGYKFGNMKNAESLQAEFIRHQGDKLIDCLGKISTTLNQLCDSLQESG